MRVGTSAAVANGEAHHVRAGAVVGMRWMLRESRSAISKIPAVEQATRRRSRRVGKGYKAALRPAAKRCLTAGACAAYRNGIASGVGTSAAVANGQAYQVVAVAVVSMCWVLREGGSAISKIPAVEQTATT